jgi:hypothetical protein
MKMLNDEPARNAAYTIPTRALPEVMCLFFSSASTGIATGNASAARIEWLLKSNLPC